MHPKLDATPRCAFRTAAPESEATNLVSSMVVAVSARLALTASSTRHWCQKLVQTDSLIPEDLSNKFLESRITGKVRA
jgi:hypothetical protein